MKGFMGFRGAGGVAAIDDPDAEVQHEKNTKNIQKKLKNKKRSTETVNIT